MASCSERVSRRDPAHGEREEEKDRQDNERLVGMPFEEPHACKSDEEDRGSDDAIGSFSQASLRPTFAAKGHEQRLSFS